MGYTHYWNYPPKDTEAVKAGFERAKTTILDIFKRHEDSPDGEQLRNNIIWLDGTCETFVVKMFATHVRADGTDDPDDDFHCCKTGRDPYDLPVCEALLALAYHVPGFVIRSDGFYMDFDYDEANGVINGLDENWPQAIANVKEHYGIEFEYAIERSPCPSYGKPGKPAFFRKVIPTPLRNSADENVLRFNP